MFNAVIDRIKSLDIFRDYNFYIVLIVALILFGYSIDSAYNRILYNIFFIAMFAFMIINKKLIFQKSNLTNFKAMFAIMFYIAIFVVIAYMNDYNTYQLSSISDISKWFIKPFILCFLMYIFVRNISEQNLNIFLAFILLIFIIVVIATNIVWIINPTKNFGRIVPFNLVIFTNIIWVIAPLAASIAMIIYTKHTLKILSIVCLCVSILALVAGESRTFTLAFLLMICISSMFVCSKRTVFIVILSLIVGICLFYKYSIYLGDRYNVNKALQNFKMVVENTPGEMGKYDACCKNNNCVFQCSPLSYPLDSNIAWESSSLNRISMYKSLYLAIIQDPFTPKTVNVFDVTKYLDRYFVNNKEYTNYGKTKDDINVTFWAHLHSEFLSKIFSLGIFGFLGIIAMHCYLIHIAWCINQRDSIRDKIIGCSYFLFIGGLFVGSLFDAFYPVIVNPIYLFFGILLGYYYRNNNTTMRFNMEINSVDEQCDN